MVLIPRKMGTEEDWALVTTGEMPGTITNPIIDRVSQKLPIIKYPPLVVEGGSLVGSAQVVVAEEHGEDLQEPILRL